MQRSVAVDLQFVAGNPNLTFIFFIALTLLTTLSLRFGYYALCNRRASDLVAEHRLWDGLALAGLFAGLFALLWLLEIVTTLALPFRDALLLADVLVLAVTMRVLYRNVVPSESRGRGLDQALILAAIVGIAAVFAGLLALGRQPLLVAVTGFSAMAFASAGVSYGRSGAAATRVQGTVVDTLLRHLLPVQLFAALVLVIDLATLVGLDRAIVLHVQVVFVIMTATALMTATIKLRQNLAGL